MLGLWLGPWVREWAYVLAGALALPLGWALLGKAIPALGSVGAHRAPELADRLLERAGLLFAMAVPLALWLAARREHATGCARPGSSTSTRWSSGCC